MTEPSASASTKDEGRNGRKDLSRHGLETVGNVYWNLSPPELYEESLSRGDGKLVHMGAIATYTAPHTGRSPKDRFVVRDENSENEVSWGVVNVPVTAEHFEALRADVIEYLGERDLFVQDARAGEDATHGINVRVVSESAWHSLFAYNMFLRLDEDKLEDFAPEFTVLHAPHLKADPERHGCRSETAVMLNFTRREVLVTGTRYAGEIKKSIFSVLNHLLPAEGVLPMHCSANVGKEGDVAIFFGLSGTGKTTLSADSTRGLIGDDEHGWSDSGVFNFEGGCYAKTISLSPEGEPEIYQATQTFGTILENIILDDKREIDFNDGTITDNTRASYPIHYIPNAVLPSRGGHPDTVVFLTADAFGVLPPISRLTPEQAMYHYLSGYTAKVAGTERGVTEPVVTFSSCFGAPFLPRHPGVYAEMLGEKLRKHGAKVWLVNTGWTGGAYGVGTRMKLEYTRAMVNSALAGELDDADYVTDPVFGLEVPSSVPGVPDDVLQPRATWADADEYDTSAQRLAEMFKENFKKFADQVSEPIRTAGPPPSRDRIGARVRGSALNSRPRVQHKIAGRRGVNSTRVPLVR
ncbi:phosphoenolpyruvate carboxykinase [Chloropicon primus]|uniref:phosphoenolpyruvate carboxykinase (ATP) n=2 Tax=Chloropicon primus TaxID=1764295 RepID=A0A5B8MGX1_9CHLO|nr:phosphoenolpyruvate carboxykinase [Chloropicon primus]UPQ98908.1 phosphoenolpyruvate carboxykinase [Chloropicon primus]|eukprot:QDZ19696.1 phosphoenolpyruvate carboxykinase [Chloropicon primus]